MKTLVTLLAVPLFTFLLSVNALGDQSSPSESDESGFDLKASIGTGFLFLDSVSGQGVVAGAGGAPESRIASSEAMSFDRIDLVLNRRYPGGWHINVSYMSGSDSIISAIPAGRNGDLFIRTNERGFNGRTFTGFPAQETLASDLSIYDFTYGTPSVDDLLEGFSTFALPKRPDSQLGGYVYLEDGSMDVESRFRLRDFPGTGSMTNHEFDWQTFGVGGTYSIMRPISDDWHFRFLADVAVGRSSIDLNSTQTIRNVPNPDVMLATQDDRSSFVFVATLEGAFKKNWSEDFAVEFFARTGVRTLPSLRQPTGQQILNGQINEIDMTHPQEVWVGVRIEYHPPFGGF